MKTRMSVLSAITAVAAAAFLATASTGNATTIISNNPAVNEAVQSVIPDTACSASTRLMSLGVDLQLTLPYASGAYVAYAFRYWRVDWGMNRISQIYTDSSYRGPYRVVNYNGSNIVPVPMGGGTVSPGLGHFVVEVNIAVWNPTGGQYIYTGWLHLNSYTTYFQNSLGTERTQLSYCATSLIA